MGSSPRLAESNTLKDSHLLICVTGCYRVSGYDNTVLGELCELNGFYL